MSGLDLSFMRRVYPVSAILTACAFLGAYFLAGYWPALGVLVGGAFGIINMMLLSRAVAALIRSGELDTLEIVVTFAVKFPLALGLIGIVLLKGWIDPLGFVIGFPLVFIAVFAALVWHYYIGGERTDRRIQTAPGAGPEKEGGAT